MTERDYTTRLVKKLNAVPGCKARTLPDTGNVTHAKPYDFFLIYRGKHVSIEAKMLGGTVTDDQKKALMDDTRAGARSFVVWYTSTRCRFVNVLTLAHYEYEWNDLDDARTAEKLLREVLTK